MSQLAGIFLACAAVALGRAIQIRDGFFDPSAFTWLNLALGCVLAAHSVRRHAEKTYLDAVAFVVLAAGLAWQFAMLFTTRPALYIDFALPSERPLFLGGLVLAAVLSVGVAVGGSRVRRTAFLGALIVHLLLGTWMLRQSPRPRIDVVTVHRAAIAALKRGESPYSITFRNIYNSTEFYAPELTADGRVLFGLPYPPVSLLMALPGALLFNDYRYSILAALTATGAAIGALGATSGRQQGWFAERRAMMAALIVLFTPRVFFALEQGWTEPFLMLLLATTVLTATRPAGRSGWCAGVLVAVKQYAVLLAPLAVLLWGETRFAVRRAVTAGAVAAAFTLPFVVWDPAGFLNSVVWLQLAEPFRMDSLSYLSFLGRLNLIREPHLWITLSAATIACALALWRLPRTPAAFAAGSALVLFVSFAFGKKAFCNYYLGVIAALCTAVAASGSGVVSERALEDAKGRARGPVTSPA